MQTRYIADLHLYDVYSLEWRKKWNGLQDYAEHLKDCWERSVPPDDTVIIVGDIGLCCDMTITLLSELPGKKVLVRGNHDVTWGSVLWECGVFQGIYDELRRTNIYIKHIPDVSVFEGYFIHGHHHFYNTSGMRKEFLRYCADTYRLNCAADIIGNRPMTLQELVINKEILMEDLRNG